MGEERVCKQHGVFPCRKCGTKHFENCGCYFCREEEQPTDKSPVTNLKDFKRKPDPNVIKVLKELLELAENGEVKGVVYAALHYDELCSSGLEGIYNRRLVGSIEVQKIELANLILEDE